MSWIISNPVDDFQLAWSVILRPCFLVSMLIVACCVLAAKLLTIKRCVLRRIALCLITISCLVITALRVYQYAFPALNTEQGHENYSAHFNDMQKVQIQAARKHGISPLKNRTEADAFIKSGEIVKITSTKNYQLAPMGHSIPYLTDSAAELLNTIGANFRDSLDSKGLSEHKILVTSILRTETDIERLMKKNSVAVKNSAHRHATTFDISYRNFVPVGLFNNTDEGELKKVLAEVLRDLRDKKLCYVRYESSQSCFHITTRK